MLNMLFTALLLCLITSTGYGSGSQGTAGKLFTYVKSSHNQIMHKPAPLSEPQGMVQPQHLSWRLAKRVVHGCYACQARLQCAAHANCQLIQPGLYGVSHLKQQQQQGAAAGAMRQVSNWATPDERYTS
jgi:hypothetical protein